MTLMEEKVKNEKAEKGFSLVLSFGKWGGFYLNRKYMFRLCIGWVAFTIIPKDLDVILKRLAKFLKDEEMKKSLKGVMEGISKIKWEEPVFYYKFPDKEEDFTVAEMAQWAEAIEHYYAIAKYWEEQERGGACSVDRAYSHWLKPRCEEFLKYFYKHIEALKHIDPNRKLAKDVWESYKHFDKEFCDKKLSYGGGEPPDAKHWVLYELWQIVRKENGGV